jgi:hypothetical protein
MNPLFFKFKAFWLFIKGKIKLHQTLIKRLVIGFIAIIVLLMIGGFLYYNFYFKKDRLIKYAPKETIFYSTLRINGEVKNNLLINRLAAIFGKEHNLSDIDFSILNPYVGYNAAMAIIPNQNNYYQFDYLFLFDLRKRPEENMLIDKGLYWFYLKNEYFNTDILAISNSPQVIEKVKLVRNQEAQSLASRIGVTLNLNNIKIGRPGKIFIDLDSLSKHYDEMSDFKIKMLLASLKNKFPNELYLGMDLNNNQILLSNEELNREATELLLSSVPTGYIANLITNNSQKSLNEIISVLSEIEPGFYQQVLKNKEYSQGLYNLDWQSDVLPFFSKKAQLLIYPNQRYLLALNVGQDSDINQRLSKLEEVIGSIYDVNEPRQKEKRLPDGSYITQIVRDNSLAFKSSIVNDIDLRLLSRNNLEFGYYLDNDRLILANSEELLNNLVNNNDLNIINTENLTNYSTNLTIFPAYYSNIWPILANINTIGYSDENNKIWLILK